MKRSITRYKGLLVILSIMLVLAVGVVMPAIVHADSSGIPVGCPGNSDSGPKDPKAVCPKLAGSKDALNCTADQTPTKLSSGPKKDSWYCKDNTPANPAGQAQQNGTFSTGDNSNKTIRDVCGDGNDATGLSINIGCRGKGNPIADMLFAIIRIASDGVGVVIVGSIVFGGIQYTGSRGDPQSTAMAVNRIRSSVFALLLFIFGYAILNFIIPAGFL